MHGLRDVSVEEPLEAACRLLAAGRSAEALQAVIGLVDLGLAAQTASATRKEAAYIALRALPEEQETKYREALEAWLLASAGSATSPRVSSHQILHAVGLSALSAGRPRRALRSFAAALRGPLGEGARARVADLAATALMELGRNVAARLLAVREQSRAPHEKLGWLFLRRAALASQALGELDVAADYARRCIEHPFFPATMRSELEPLLRESSITG